MIRDKCHERKERSKWDKEIRGEVLAWPGGRREHAQGKKQDAEPLHDPSIQKVNLCRISSTTGRDHANPSPSPKFRPGLWTTKKKQRRFAHLSFSVDCQSAMPSNRLTFCCRSYFLVWTSPKMDPLAYLDRDHQDPCSDKDTARLFCMSHFLASTYL